jgi:TRAP-type C4-dicarboxylate transport system permease small subunit
MQKILDRCELVLTYAAAMATFIMMILTTLDAAGRYLLNRPITGAYEITANYLMVAAIFFGASHAYRGGAYLRVTLLVDRLPRAVKIYVNYFVQVASVAYGFALVGATTKHALSNIASGPTLSSIDFPLGPAFLLAPIGLLLMSLLMLFDIRKVRKGKSPLFREESPTS